MLTLNEPRLKLNIVGDPPANCSFEAAYKHFLELQKSFLEVQLHGQLPPHPDNGTPAHLVLATLTCLLEGRQLNFEPLPVPSEVSLDTHLVRAIFELKRRHGTRPNVIGPHVAAAAEQLQEVRFIARRAAKQLTEPRLTT